MRPPRPPSSARLPKNPASAASHDPREPQHRVYYSHWGTVRSSKASKEKS